ncbi:hypothetical protein GCM10010211_36850 [Streptomyces albospinus]|uniref:Uncharacterized protein n=1 Tax=Streptomyces albospinus TaxID=285515 RepID=A0ABQ2V467_9ACTN|nr:hypothetical protein GCM10010211_36850 [Streptomyces albospinus]
MSFTAERAFPAYAAESLRKVPSTGSAQDTLTEDMALLTRLSQPFLWMLDSGQRRLTNIDRVIVLLDGLGAPPTSQDRCFLPRSRRTCLSNQSPDPGMRRPRLGNVHC